MVRTGARADLDRACALFASVTEKDPRFAAAWSGLGNCWSAIRAPRFGGGQIHVMHARRALDEALRLDPSATEANLYAFICCSRAAKKNRHGTASLTCSPSGPNDWNVHCVAASRYGGDGMYDEATATVQPCFQMNPANAAISTTTVPRVYHYQNQN